MIIAPLEIRQKTFLRGFRGYEKEEVDTFLNSLSQEWEKIIEANKDLKRKLEQAENESQKLKAVESSLFRTLKTAEDASTSIIAQAEQNATERIEQSESIAQALINEATLKSEEIIAEAEMRSKSSLSNLDVKVSGLRTEVKELESLKTKFISELSKVAQNTLDRIAKITPKNFNEETASQIEFTATETQNEIATLIENKSTEAPIPPLLINNTPKVEEIKTQVEAPIMAKKQVSIELVDNIDHDNEVRKTTCVATEDISFFDMIK